MAPSLPSSAPSRRQPSHATFLIGKAQPVSTLLLVQDRDAENGHLQTFYAPGYYHP